jgi:hypothetical protein
VTHKNDWMGVAFDAWRLGMEASTVVGLRMAKLAAGDAEALAEAQRMVGEKIDAAAQLQMLAMTGGLGLTPQRQASAAIAHVRKTVARNRRRLSRGKR